jgi:hypothetical protein
MLGWLVVCSVLVVWAAGPLSPAGSSARGATRAAAARGRAEYAGLGTAFEANRGQAPRSVAYLAHGPGYSLGLGAGVARLALSRRIGHQVQASVIGLRASGGHLGLPTAGDALAGRVDYLIGSDRSKWLHDVPTYGSVTYRDVWPGVSLAFHGRGGALEFDFDLAPGSGASAIALRFRGARKLRNASDGGVTLNAAHGSVRILAPVAYQAGGHGTRVRVASRLIVHGTTLRVWLGRHDHHRAVVIDPSLVYSTYLGGSGGDYGNKLAVDSAGDVYVTGDTTSPDFPFTTGAYQTTFGGTGAGDGFVTKLDPQGALVYSTYLGGSADADASGIAVDSSGDAYVTGSTSSANFPTSSGAYQTAYGGGGDAFVAELNRLGSGLVYSTYLGGSGADDAYAGIVLDAAGDAYVAGSAGSGFPVMSGSYQTAFGGGVSDAFVAELKPGGSGLVYSTYLGGSGADAAFALTVDPSGAVYVSGGTSSASFPLTSGAYATRGEAFMSKLNPGGSSLAYSTYFDGNPQAVAVDSAGEAYLAGRANSSSFPTTPNAFQTTFTSGTGQGDQPAGDGFVTKFNSAGTGLVYSSYLGGSSGGGASGIALDSSGDAYLTGTASAGLPTSPGAYQATGTGAFVTELNVGGTGLLYSSYLGASSENLGDAIAIDSSGDVDVTGHANAGFPTTAGAAQSGFGGGSFDAFVVKLVPLPILRFTLSVSDAGSGSVSSSPVGIACGSACFASFANGTEVTLTATAASGSSFAGWTGGACAGTGTCTVPLTADTAVGASFTVNPPARTSNPPAGPPVNRSVPAHSGTALPGDTLSCSTGTWKGTPTHYAYEWKRNGVAIAGATGARYKVQIADEAKTLTCTVTASNSAGVGASQTSAGTLVAVKGTLSCPKPSGNLSDSKLGPLTLGMSRAKARKALRRYTADPNQLDDFCLYAGFGIRVGYPSAQLLGALSRTQRSQVSGKIVLALTANPFYSLDGARPGMALKAVAKRLKLGKVFRIAGDDWYIAPGKRANGILKVRAGIVQEVGLADKQLTNGRQAQARLLDSLKTA